MVLLQYIYLKRVAKPKYEKIPPDCTFKQLNNSNLAISYSNLPYINLKDVQG